MKEKQMKNLSAMNLQPEKSFPRKEGEVKRFPDNLKFLLDLSSRNINGNLSGWSQRILNVIQIHMKKQKTIWMC